MNKRTFICSLMAWMIVAADASLARQVHEAVLANGIRFYQVENKTAPDLFDMFMLVAVGSEDEKLSQAGISHLLEHIVFQTRTRYGGSLASELDGRGIVYRGKTSLYHTMFGIQGVPIEELDEMLALWAEALFAPCYPNQEHYARERQVVCEEIQMRGAPDVPTLRISPGQNLQIVTMTLYGIDDFLRWTPGGFYPTVAGLKLAQVSAYQKLWYQPERVQIVIGSDVPAAVVTSKVQQHFSVEQAGSKPPDSLKAKPKVLDELTVIPSPRQDSEQVGLQLGFRFPAAGTRQAHAAELALKLFNRRAEQLADERFTVWVDLLTLDRTNCIRLALVNGILNPRTSRGIDDYSSIEAAVMKLIGSVMNQPATALELMTLGYAAEKELATKSEAETLIDLLENDALETYRDYEVWLEALTPDKISQAARQIFFLERAVMVLMGEGRYQVELQSLIEITLTVAGMILPLILVVGLQFSLNRWVGDGNAVLYLIRPIGRIRLLGARTGAALLLSTGILIILIGIVQALFAALGGGVLWRIWLLAPVLLLVILTVTVIHTALYLVLGRPTLALLGSLLLFAIGNYSFVIQQLAHDYFRGWAFRTGFSLLYAIIPKFGELYFFALSTVLGNDPQFSVFSILAGFVILIIVSSLLGMFAFCRKEF